MNIPKSARFFALKVAITTFGRVAVSEDPLLDGGGLLSGRDSPRCCIPSLLLDADVEREGMPVFLPIAWIR